MAMRLFKYRTWGGSIRTIEADIVRFEPSHVVFLKDLGEGVGYYFILRAESNVTCLELEEQIRSDE